MRFLVEWALRKNQLPMPPAFATLFKGEEEVGVPLLLKDEAGRSYAVHYDRVQQCIYAPGLSPWVRNYAVNTGDRIVFESVGQRTFRISVDRKGPQPTPSEGLLLGKEKDDLGRYETERNFVLPTEALLTHVFICGVTGTGKTVLGKAIIEEAVLRGVPALLVDLKGDISSAALVPDNLHADSFAPWVEVRRGENRTEKAREKAELYRERLAEFGLSEERIAELKRRASFAVFTPRVGKGIPIGITSPLAAPRDLEHLVKTDWPAVLDMIDSYTRSFVKSLFSEKKLGRLNQFRSYLTEIVKYCWCSGIPLEGLDGLRVLRQLVEEPPVREVGGMPVERFIDHKKTTELASRIAMCLAGGEQLWFYGVPLDIDTILSRPYKDRTPVSIINLSGLMSFDEQVHAVSHLAYAVSNWMRPQGDAGGTPRLVFFIDEIGGGGGRQAFFPSLPYDPPSKSGLNLLLRQGRAFGVCCVFATQNPGDVDYRGLSNCGTWIVSRLQTDRDRKKILQGLSAAEMHIERADDKLRALQYGEFLAKPKDGSARVFVERWLMSFHKTLSDDELKALNSEEIKRWFEERIEDSKQERVQPLALPSPGV